MPAVGTTFYLNWEVSLMEWLQATLPPALIQVVSQFSLFGEEMLLIVILGFLYWCWDKEYGKKAGIAIIVVNIWNPMIKNIVLRRRPYFDNPGIKLFRKIDADADIYDIAAQGFSFPSGHSANAAVVYGSIAQTRRNRIKLILAVILPLLVGFSRVCVGAHYPTDVLGGFLLGAIILAVVPWLRNKLSRPMFYGLLLLIALPGIFYCTSSDYFTGLGMMIGFVAGDFFEDRFVHFENTRSIWRCILRLLGGGGLYLVLNKLLKLPFSAEFLDSGTLAAHLVRTGRYAIILFVVIGLYPLLFGLFKGEKKDSAR